MLSPLRVLDLSDESGFLCGKIYADLGADVIKVEPPGGDAARRVGPFSGDDPAPEKSLYWLSYNHNKRGISLDLTRRRGRRLLLRLVEAADFMVETFPPGTLAELGLGYPAMRAVNPGLVLISITPFGQTGPYRDYKGGDLVAMAMSGMMSLIGEPDHAPLRVSLPQAPMWAGMYAAAGGLVAHHYRVRTDLGQQVDISLQAGLLWALANAPSFWATNRTVPRRDGRQITGRSITGATMKAIFRCKDGYINFIIYGGAAGRRSNQALVRWLEEEGLATRGLRTRDWSDFNIAVSDQAEIDELEAPAAELFLRYTKAEFLEQGFKRGMLGYPVAGPADILVDPHLQARAFWREVEFPGTERPVRFPGRFARFSGVAPVPWRPAPQVGEHNAEIFMGELGLDPEAYQALRSERII